MTEREALKLALEALKHVWNTTPDDDPIVDKALDAIIEALAQPEQEFVANYCKECLTYNGHYEGCSHYTTPPQPEQEPRAWINWSALTGEPRLGWECESELASEPLYTAPPQRKPEQEPVAWGMPSAGEGHIVDVITPEEHDRVEGGYTIPLYTTPPQRTWVGLTDEEIAILIVRYHRDNWRLIKEAEAKLKEKNT